MYTFKATFINPKDRLNIKSNYVFYFEIIHLKVDCKTEIRANETTPTLLSINNIIRQDIYLFNLKRFRHHICSRCDVIFLIHTVLLSHRDK